jgi:apolipoprotein N-acyltransferase
MNTKIKRPPAVWLTQSLLIIFAMLWLFVFVFQLVRMLRNGLSEGVSIVRPLIGFPIILGFACLLLLAFWGMAKRKTYGRWLSVLSLILLWGLILYIRIYPSTGPWKRYEFNSPAERAGGVVGQILISAVFLILILRLAFAKRVDEFFRDRKEVSRVI